MNVIDSLILFNISLLSALLSLFYTSARSPGSSRFSPGVVLWMIAFVACWPIIGFVIVFLVFVHRRQQVSKWLSKIKQSCCTCHKEEMQCVSASVNPALDDELPDRFVHPDNYEIEATNKALHPPIPPPVHTVDINISAY